ncbi:MAG: BolA family transcriptional regulator [Thiobacillaceae bacterium]|nr:BolA family transcriptional regulator [Thiobacillaceae bacterium]MCX7673947.1 BolA family transcriptional regulator [Thiobacillaceae bacterium]MDW8322825.1 BolA family protein [Burkholderiales bacterium]
MNETEALMRERLATLEPQMVRIDDESALHAGHAGARSGGGHYHLTIVSHRFAGLDALARHRLVYAALGGLMGSRIHALSIRALAPDET